MTIKNMIKKIRKLISCLIESIGGIFRKGKKQEPPEEPEEIKEPEEKKEDKSVFPY